MDTLYLIDLDGVVFDFLNGFLTYANEITGLHIKEIDIARPGFEHFPCPLNSNLNFEAWIELFQDFEKDIGYQLLELIPDAAEGMKQLFKSSALLIFITARPLTASLETLAALRSAEISWDLLFFKASKISFAQLYKGKFRRIVLIEDQARNLIPATPFIDQGYLMPWTHNLHTKLPTNIERVVGWKEIIEKELR